MPEYLWSGTSPSGEKNGAERVQAENVEAAKAILTARGWTNLQLHTSEISDYIHKAMAQVTPEEYQPNLTPKQQLQFHKGEHPKFWRRWIDSMVEAKGTIGFCALLLAWSIFRHRTWGIIVCSAALFAVIFLFPAIHWWFAATSKLFVRLNTARTWWRWEEVLQCIDEMKKAHQRTKLGIGPAELARYWGLALAGTGQVEQGITIFSKEAAASNMPQWMRLSHIATMYNVAQQFDKALEVRRECFAVSGEDAIAGIDLASYLLDPFEFVDEAKALLAKVETKTLPAIAVPSISRLRGMIAHREKDFRLADRYFRESLAGTLQSAKNRYHVFEASILLLNARLAIVNAALGNKAEAENFFKASRDYLAATKRQDLIDDYHNHLGRNPVPQAT